MFAPWTLLNPLFRLLLLVSPVTIVLPGFAVLVIAYFENCSSYGGYHEKMDWTAAGVEPDPRAAGGLLR